MIVYNSADIYISSATDLREKIRRINLVIDALMTTSLTAATKGELTEHWMDDGQIKTKIAYSSPESLAKSIRAFKQIRQEYINELNGGSKFTLVDGKNFIRTRYGR